MSNIPRFDVITLFPEMVQAVFAQGVVGKAKESHKWELHTWQLRDFATDARKTVDERPYGGGPGMVMQPAPLKACIQAIQQDRSRCLYTESPVILLSPAGIPFRQSKAEQMAQSEGAIIVCGRYEGIDQRIIDGYVTESISVGDYILSGGEIAACAVMDACIRLVPGVLNDYASCEQDSFSTYHQGLLDYPHYTRPEVFDNIPVPEVLLSGDHAKIAAWRQQAALEVTQRVRPDLLLPSKT